MASVGPFDTSGAWEGAPRGGAERVLAGRYGRGERRLPSGDTPSPGLKGAARRVALEALRRARLRGRRPLSERRFVRRSPHPCQDRGTAAERREVSPAPWPSTIRISSSAASRRASQLEGCVKNQFQWLRIQ
ncbi:PHD finger-like domain-containing protein 5A isoform X1 [Phasianus colchicus]|uniref:PHD finger-like domain-containing protein 5A isoform X1 n=1 Tax=Phasianus colchicus TaxID=9054 RepID=UPI00129E3D73|nr:PHD finger-like domain-containing protein 5A isoform X1 [Phasianus colchicus]